MSHPKEDAYDTFIAPLMAEIIAVAKGHKINMFATFMLDSDGDADGPLMREPGGTTAVAVLTGHEIRKSLRRMIRRYARAGFGDPINPEPTPATVPSFGEPVEHLRHRVGGLL